MGEILEIKKILVVASTTKFTTSNYLVSALKRNGIEVFVYSDVSGFESDMKGNEFVSVIRILKYTPFKPDLFLYVEGGTMKLFPYDLEKLNCLTVWYGIDTHMDYEKHLKISRGFDVTFIAQKQYVERLKIDGIHHVFWLPLGIAPEIYSKIKCSKKIYDISYVGGMSKNHNPERMALIDSIKQRFKNYRFFFGVADPEEMIRIYSQSWIVFNKSINNDINMRVFEGAASGALVFTDPIIENGWKELFQNAPFIIYNNGENLLNQLESYLNNKEKIQNKSSKLLKLLWEKHTYDKRVKSMLNLLSGLEKTFVSPDPSYYHSVLSALKMKKKLVGFLLKESIRNTWLN